MNPIRDPATRERGQILIILLGSLLLGGGVGIASGVVLTGKSVSEIEKAVRGAVPEGDRRDRSLRILGRWEREAREYFETYESTRGKILARLRDHERDRSTIDRRIEELDRKTDRIVDRVLEHRRGLRERLTDEEWIAVFGTDSPR